MFSPNPKPPKKEKRPRVFIKRTPLKKTYKKTGEQELFEKLIQERPNVSFITGATIPNISFYNCHHVLTKAAHGKFRLTPDNIIFLSNEEHQKIHTTAKSDLINSDVRWMAYFILYDTLKIKYSQL